MKIRLCTIAAALIILFQLVSPVRADVPYGLSYLTVGVGGRAVGMGEAAVAIADDPTAAYWNPAGLVSASKSAAVFTYHRWIQDVAGQFAAGNYRWHQSALAIHYLGMNVDDLELRTSPSENPIGTFGAHDICLGLSYARILYPKLQLGMTLKLLWESIYTETSEGWALDFGVQHHGFIPGLSVGAALRNLGEMNALRYEGPSLPARFRIGAAYQFSGTGILPVPSILVASDAELPFGGDPNGHFGIEVRPITPLALRTGYILGVEARSFTAGFGIDWSRFHVNYGFAPFKEDLGDGHRFSLGLDF
jgi:hypothetical protein